MACSRASRSFSSRYSMVSVGIGSPFEMTQISWSSLITPDHSKIERGTRRFGLASRRYGSHNRSMRVRTERIFGFPEIVSGMPRDRMARGDDPRASLMDLVAGQAKATYGGSGEDTGRGA